jgi:hypothetical protein
MELSSADRALAARFAGPLEDEPANDHTGPLQAFVVVFSGNGRRDRLEVMAPDRAAAVERHEDLCPAGCQAVAYTPEEWAAQQAVTTKAAAAARLHEDRAFRLQIQHQDATGSFL